GRRVGALPHRETAPAGAVFVSGRQPGGPRRVYRGMEATPPPPPHRPVHHAALRALAAVILALLATDAWAAVLYKLTDATGHVTYTDAVPRGFRGQVRRLEIDTTRPAPSGPLAARDPEAALAEYERIIGSRPDTSARDRRVEAARARLEAARAALDLARTNS